MYTNNYSILNLERNHFYVISMNMSPVT